MRAVECSRTSQGRQDKVHTFLPSRNVLRLQSTRKYNRSCRNFLRKVALTCLKKYGVYLFFFQVAEPGVSVKSDMSVVYACPGCSDFVLTACAQHRL